MGSESPSPPFMLCHWMEQENSDLPFNRLHSSLKIVSLALGSKHVESTNQDMAKEGNRTRPKIMKVLAKVLIWCRGVNFVG